MSQHTFNVTKSPISFTVRCSCGFCRQVPRQNALARAAKVKSIMRQHLDEVAQRTGGDNEPAR